MENSQIAFCFIYFFILKNVICLCCVTQPVTNFGGGRAELAQKWRLNKFYVVFGGFSGRALSSLPGIRPPRRVSFQGRKVENLKLWMRLEFKIGWGMRCFQI